MNFLQTLFIVIKEQDEQRTSTKAQAQDLGGFKISTSAQNGQIGKNVTFL